MILNNDENIESLKAENSRLVEKIKSLEKRLSMSSSSFLNIVGKSLDGIVIVDQEKMVVYTNYAAMELFDRNIADLLGEPLDLGCDTKQLFQNTETSTEIEIPQADGTMSIAEASVMKSEWNNEPCFVVSFRNITERKKSEELLQYMSHHDYLTDLPNRVFFEKKMKLAIDEAKDKKQHMALMYLDLDNFKVVNDTLGHDVGDALLKRVSSALKGSLRVGDCVARLGGDEFAIILTNLRKPGYAEIVANSILNKLSESFKLDNHDVYANASIGIAVYPMAGMDMVSLVKSADTAMYNAKKCGKNQYRFYSAELNQDSEKNLSIINGLRVALRQDEFFLEYQPIVDVSTGACCGIEALLRWNHPQLGLVPPDVFLPFAEDASLMMKIGQWVLQNALADFKKINNPSLRFISINMSANELDGARTAKIVYDLIGKTGISTKEVVLELTETSIMKNPEASIDKFKKLSNIGVSIAVDDFGTGYSSLNYLKRLPVQILKIDKSFVDDIGDDHDDEVIVESTIKLAHGLGLKVIAEGVETKAQLDFLKKNSCDYVQGYYYSKSLSFEALRAYLKKS